jgi:hypothetical protein
MLGRMDHRPRSSSSLVYRDHVCFDLEKSRGTQVMSSTAPPPFWDRVAWGGIADEEVVERVRSGDIGSYEILMRRYNQRLYSVSFSILRNHAEAEDVMQEAYIHAYQHLDQFAGEAKFSTWLTKITINESL